MGNQGGESQTGATGPASPGRQQGEPACCTAARREELQQEPLRAGAAHVGAGVSADGHAVARGVRFTGGAAKKASGYYLRPGTKCSAARDAIRCVEGSSGKKPRPPSRFGGSRSASSRWSRAGGDNRLRHSTIRWPSRRTWEPTSDRDAAQPPRLPSAPQRTSTCRHHAMGHSPAAVVPGPEIERSYQGWNPQFHARFGSLRRELACRWPDYGHGSRLGAELPHQRRKTAGQSPINAACDPRIDTPNAKLGPPKG